MSFKVGGRGGQVSRAHGEQGWGADRIGRVARPWRAMDTRMDGGAGAGAVGKESWVGWNC